MLKPPLLAGQLIPFCSSAEPALHIRYVRADSIYYVTLLGPLSQNLVVQSRFFQRITGVDIRGVLGTVEISPAQAAHLGFIVEMEEVSVDECDNVAVVSA